ncbi:MAG: hypothetical protein ACM32K_00285 [Syntrophaceae bacterium]
MAKKSHADIMEKLSALRPSEPTKTRGKAARKPAVKKIKVKTAAAPKEPKAEAPSNSPKPAAPPAVMFSSPGFAGFGVFGDASKIYRGVYENWFQIVQNCNRMVADCNSMLLSNLTSLMNPGRWGRF